MFVKEKCFYLGKIIRSHGIHGHLVLASSIPLDTANTKEPFLVDIDGGLVPFYLHKKEGLKDRDHQSYLIRFDHASTKDDAEKYIGSDVYLEHTPFVDESCEKPNLNIFRGFEIFSEDNKLVGTVLDIVDYSGNTLVNIHSKNGELLLPFTEEHIVDWDLDNKKIILRIAKGLLDI
ncbi:16S rRNA processing protein RimM [Balneicella halophila]|uniref:Ribosome maturation factor RimM n=1 Tax=Balneicella halophila TaxID=1537566 RepID=A0A7L4UQW5_BALHA|nr:ribosome maturation factor RimM [Balneicella halophila]PVX50689.1 16S rRNA processing protein RimM [Balneicella halophila]